MTKTKENNEYHMSAYFWDVEMVIKAKSASEARKKFRERYRAGKFRPKISDLDAERL